MSIDTLLAILALAVSVGSLAPVFVDKGRAREVVLAVGLTTLVALACVGAWRAIAAEMEVRRVEADVLSALAARQQTLHQVELALHHPAYATLVDAIDRLVRSGKVRYQVVELYDVARNSYVVGTYSVGTLK